MMNQTLSLEIYQKALACGFENCGIIPIPDLDGYGPLLKERKGKILFGSISYALMNRLAELKQRYPWAKSVVVCTEWLGRYRYPKELRDKYGKAFLLSRNTIPGSSIYRQREEFESWMTEHGIRWDGGEKDSPVCTVPMRYAAVQAGLGVIRKNNFFYTEKGSYYNLECYLIDAECMLKHQCSLKPCSETCHFCQDACTTKALCAPYTMNPISCISFWTSLGMNILPPHLKKEQFGQWVCGCDACQDACPYNRRHDWDEGEAFPGLEALVSLLQPENLLSAADAELRSKVIPKTYDHVRPSQVNTLRRGAKRVLAGKDK